jgi:hypothetical protein
MIWVKREGENFSKRGWTGKSPDGLSGNQRHEAHFGQFAAGLTGSRLTQRGYLRSALVGVLIYRLPPLGRWSRRFISAYERNWAAAWRAFCFASPAGNCSACLIRAFFQMISRKKNGLAFKLHAGA